MTTYRIGIGHDLPLGSLTAFDPQPRNGEVRPIEREYADGGTGEIGLHCAPVWDVLESPEAYQAILTLAGVLDATTCEVTIYTRNEVFGWQRFNGIAVRPELGVDGGWSDYFPRGFALYVHSLVALEGDG